MTYLILKVDRVALEFRGNVSHQNKVIIIQYNKTISIRHKAKVGHVRTQPVIKTWSSLARDSSSVTHPTVCAGITRLLLCCPCYWNFFACRPFEWTGPGENQFTRTSSIQIPLQGSSSSSPIPHVNFLPHIMTSV